MRSAQEAAPCTANHVPSGRSCTSTKPLDRFKSDLLVFGRRNTHKNSVTGNNNAQQTRMAHRTKQLVEVDVGRRSSRFQVSHRGLKLCVACLTWAPTLVVHTVRGRHPLPTVFLWYEDGFNAWQPLLMAITTKRRRRSPHLDFCARSSCGQWRKRERLRLPRPSVTAHRDHVVHAPIACWTLLIEAFTSESSGQHRDPPSTNERVARDSTSP